MLLLAILAPFVVLATRVVAGPAKDDDNTSIVVVPITKRSTGSSAGTPNVVQKDYQRLRFLLNDGQQHESLIPDVILDDAAGQIYTAEIAVGTEYIDTVTIARDAVISRQSIGVATNAIGFSFFDGILGIGPRILTRNTTFPDNSSIIPTVADNLIGMLEGAVGSAAMFGIGK